MSVRGSSPKIASETVTEPDSLPSSVVILSSISRAPLRFGGGRSGLGRSNGSHIGKLEFAGLWHAVRQPLLHRIAHGDPAAFDAGHRAFDQNEPTLDIGLHDLEIERGHPIDAEMARHFFIFKSLAGILATAGRTDRAV